MLTYVFLNFLLLIIFSPNISSGMHSVGNSSTNLAPSAIHRFFFNVSDKKILATGSSVIALFILIVYLKNKKPNQPNDPNNVTTEHISYDPNNTTNSAQFKIDVAEAIKASLEADAQEKEELEKATLLSLESKKEEDKKRQTLPDKITFIECVNEKNRITQGDTVKKIVYTDEKKDVCRLLYTLQDPPATNPFNEYQLCTVTSLQVPDIWDELQRKYIKLLFIQFVRNVSEQNKIQSISIRIDNELDGTIKNIIKTSWISLTNNDNIFHLHLKQKSPEETTYANKMEYSYDIETDHCYTSAYIQLKQKNKKDRLSRLISK